MPRVFVSHSSRDRTFVEAVLLPHLEAHKISTWYSGQDIEPRANFERTIVDGLKSCDWFLIVMSPNAIDSDWVKSEVHWAVHARKGKIIPVMLATCEAMDLHLLLGNIQYVDFRVSHEEACAKLIAGLGIETPGPPPRRPRGGPDSVISRICDAATGSSVTVFALSLDENAEHAFFALRHTRPNDFFATQSGPTTWRFHRLHCSSLAFNGSQKLTASPKVCAETERELREWAHTFGVALVECRRCRRLK